MNSRKPLDATAILWMALTCCIWAFQQIALKATGDLAAPVFQIGFRSGVAAILVLAVILFRRERLELWGPTAFAGAVAGVLFAVEFLLVGISIRYTSASHVVVFLYTAPIFAGLGLHLKLPSERLSVMQWSGIGLAAAGIAIAFLAHAPQPDGGLGDMLIGDVLALLAGALWGFTTFLIRVTRLSSTPATHTLFYQLATGAVLLIGSAVVTGHAGIVPTPLLFAELAFQSLVVSFFSYLAWFWLLTRYRASELGVFSFSTPLLGVVLGWLLLGEPLTGTFLAGSALVLIGIMTVSAYPWLSQRRATARESRTPAE